jgi:antitoxin component HigA of HigAB toxin-antitoxin module
MSIKPIKNEHDYEAALKRIEELFDAKQNTPEGDELEALITLVSAYEDIHHNLGVPDKIEASKRTIEAKGFSKGPKMREVSESIIKGMEEAVDFAKGEKTGTVVHNAEENTVRSTPVKKSD